MADNTILNPGVGGDTIATDDIAGVKHELVKVEFGVDGSATQVSSLNPLPTTDNAVALSVASVDLKTPALGQALAAASTPIVLTAAEEAVLSAILTIADFDSKTGSLTETAPATDTASSGVNGRLQRIAQRLTSLIALLPAALGAGGGLKIDGSGTALPVTGTLFGGAVTIADGADVTLGALADAIIAAGAAGSVSAKLRRATQGLEDLKSLIVLAAGTNAIGKLSANNGVTIGAIEIAAAQTLATVTAVTAITNALPAGTNLLGITQSKDLPDASATYALTNITSTAYEASHIIKASAGYLFMVTGYNSKTSAQFIMISNTTTVPADAQTPVVIFTVAASSNFSFDLGKYGRYFSTGICIFNSSTAPTKTLASADCFFDCQII